MTMSYTHFTDLAKELKTLKTKQSDW